MYTSIFNIQKKTIYRDTLIELILLHCILMTRIVYYLDIHLKIIHEKNHLNPNHLITQYNGYLFNFFESTVFIYFVGHYDLMVSNLSNFFCKYNL